MKPNILIVTASDGKNLELANKLQELSSDFNGEFNVVKLSDYDLPVYSTAAEQEGTPDAAKALTDKFLSADGFIFLSPEYNGSVTPSFINSIAWISRSGNEDWRAAFNNKPAAIGTHSGGGGNHVLMAMQSQLSFIGCHIVGRKLLTSYSKELNEDSAKSVLDLISKLSTK